MIWKGLKYQTHDFSNKYEISEYGDIRNIQTGRILKPQVNRGGYKFVCISLNKCLEIGQRKIIIIHKAVAYTFLDNHSHYSVVDHIDCNKQNNHYKNLEWVTAKENSRRAYRNGLFLSPLQTNVIKRKLTEQNVCDIKTLLKNGALTHAMIARQFSVSRATISQISAGTIHKNVGI